VKGEYVPARTFRRGCAPGPPTDARRFRRRTEGLSKAQDTTDCQTVDALELARCDGAVRAGRRDAPLTGDRRAAILVTWRASRALRGGADMGRRFEGFEVDARNIQNVIDAFRLFPDAGLKPLLRHGVGTLDASGKIVVPTSGWHPMDAWVATLEDILDEVGPSKMYDIGKQIPKNARFPPGIDDVRAGLGSLDVAYHMNHRRNGVVMFDPATGVMLEGIGHFRVTVEDRRATLECDNPYPCDFDRGILVAMAMRFEKGARISHLDEIRCRKHGLPMCRYRIEW
jgi:hypothetical protein